jgi:hypothetical protein
MYHLLNFEKKPGLKEKLLPPSTNHPDIVAHIFQVSENWEVRQSLAQKCWREPLEKAGNAWIESGGDSESRSWFLERQPSIGRLFKLNR